MLPKVVVVGHSLLALGVLVVAARRSVYVVAVCCVCFVLLFKCVLVLVRWFVIMLPVSL